MIRRIALIAIPAALVAVAGVAVMIRMTAQNQGMEPDMELMAQAPPQDAPPGQDPPAPDGQQRPEGRGLLRDLNLSQDQTQKIQAIRSRDREQMRSDRDTIRKAQQELQNLMAGNATDDQIRAKYQQVRELRLKMADAQFNSMLEIRNVLNTDQRRKFAEQMEKQRQNFRDRMPGRPPEPGNS